MEEFEKIIDTYLSKYSTYENGKIVFECDYGELIFLKSDANILTIYGIYIHPEYRQKGLCRNILHYLIDASSKNTLLPRHPFKELCIQSVLSNILYNYLCRFKYNNKIFTKHREGFFYKL